MDPVFQSWASVVVLTLNYSYRYIQIDKSTGNLQAQVGLAAVSCRITETLMGCYDRLNKVPCSLISQLRRINDLDKYRLKENSPVCFEFECFECIHIRNFFSENHWNVPSWLPISDNIDSGIGVYSLRNMWKEKRSLHL